MVPLEGLVDSNLLGPFYFQKGDPPMLPSEQKNLRHVSVHHWTEEEKGKHYLVVQVNASTNQRTECSHEIRCPIPLEEWAPAADTTADIIRSSPRSLHLTNAPVDLYRTKIPASHTAPAIKF